MNCLWEGIPCTIKQDELNLYMLVFWVVTSYVFVGRYQHFRATYWHHLKWDWLKNPDAWIGSSGRWRGDRFEASSQHEQREWLTTKQVMETSHSSFQEAKASCHQGHAMHFISFLLSWWSLLGPSLIPVWDCSKQVPFVCLFWPVCHIYHGPPFLLLLSHLFPRPFVHPSLSSGHLSTLCLPSLFILWTILFSHLWLLLHPAFCSWDTHLKLYSDLKK